jgi:hypothetical protein
MRGHTLLIAGAMIGALLSSHAATAQAPAPTNETWVCTDKTSSGQTRAPLEFVLENGYLSAQPLGVPRYRVLDSTRYGLVAVEYSADRDWDLSVYMGTVMIDRVSGEFTTALISSGSTTELRTGHCRTREAQSAQTVGAAVAAAKK